MPILWEVVKVSGPIYTTFSFRSSEARRFFIIIIIKKIGNARSGEGDLHPISRKTPAAHYQTIEEKKRMGSWKEEKGKIVEDKKGESN